MADEGSDLVDEKAEEKRKAVVDEAGEGERSEGVKDKTVEEPSQQGVPEGAEVKNEDFEGEREKEGVEERETKEREALEEAVAEEKTVRKKRTVKKYIKKKVLEGEQLEGEQGEEQEEWILEELSDESVQEEAILDKDLSLGEGNGEEVVEEEKEERSGEEQQFEAEEEKEPKTSPAEEEVEEEYQFFEEVIDPAAPFCFTDSEEALKKPFELKPDELAEVEQLWDVFQDHTPAYCNLDGFITSKELVYMLKSIMLMPFTEEQLQELIDFCVRPPHPKGHINFDQFVKIVTLRKRDCPLEEELRACLELLDPEKTGSVDRAYLMEVVGTLGYKMPRRMLENFIKEVDIANDGTIGIDDVVGTIMMDLNRDDINMLMTLIYPDEEPVYGEGEEGDLKE